MIDGFRFSLPVKIRFGAGLSGSLGEITRGDGFERGVLISDRLFIENGTAEKIKNSAGNIIAVYGGVTPNPLLSEVEAAARFLREKNADFVAALGGGSAIDLAKFAASLVFADGPAEDYFYKRKTFEKRGLPLIAIPTTAGTGSEVTAVSVCNDGLTGAKAPLSHPNFYPYIAVVDPELTLSAPPYVTAVTGLDAMSHALEAYWSLNHQPISDMFALESLKLIFGNLERAYSDGKDIAARSAMSLGALYAGIAFQETKTAAVHAASYPLSERFGLPHGEACAFTLPLFLLANAEVEKERLGALAVNLGFTSIAEMAEKIDGLKTKFKLKRTFKETGEADFTALARECLSHPLFTNNPRKFSDAELAGLFRKLQ